MRLFEFFPESLKKEVSLTNRKYQRTDIEFAFSRLRKLPLSTKRNILSAITHFLNVKGATADEKIEAYKKILNKAEIFKICTMGFIEQCKGLFNKEI